MIMLNMPIWPYVLFSFKNEEEAFSLRRRKLIARKANDTSEPVGSAVVVTVFNFSFGFKF